MPPFVEPPRARLTLRLVALSVLAATAAGCSADTSRFERGGPFYAARGNTPPAAVTGSIPPATNAPAHAAPTYAAPTHTAPVGRVESQPLGGSPGASLPPPPARTFASPRPAQASAQPAREPSTRPPSATKSIVHVVASGDTLITIARRYKKTTVEVARANDMKPNAHVRIGQKLTIPGVAPAPARVAAAAKPATAPAQRPAPTPAVAQPRPAAPATAQSKPAAPAAAAKPEERKPVTRGAPPANLSHPKPERVERAAVATPAAAPVEAEEAPAPSASGKPSFRWPVRGRVIAGFGPKATGQQNDGINLAVPEGTSVRAAEDGVVAYAGNELKGYGNLVLVRHSSGYVTAYAHASELKVKRGDKVRRGQIIALAGQTGGVASPQLHFEIRRGSTPVDPIQYLASN